MHLPRGLLLLVYALYRRDVVFIVGQEFGLFVHLRNLYFAGSTRHALHRFWRSSWFSRSLNAKRNVAQPAASRKFRSGVLDQAARDISSRKDIFTSATR